MFPERQFPDHFIIPNVIIPNPKSICRDEFPLPKDVSWIVRYGGILVPSIRIPIGITVIWD